MKQSTMMWIASVITTKQDSFKMAVITFCYNMKINSMYQIAVTLLVEGTQNGNVVKENFRFICNVGNNFLRKNAFIFCIIENQLKMKISECDKKGNSTYTRMENKQQTMKNI